MRIFVALALIGAAGLASAQQTTDFMGVPLGTEFNLPKCEAERRPYIHSYKSSGEQSALPCWYGPSLVISGHDTLPTTNPFRVNIMVAADRTPSGVGVVQAYVVDGTIHGMFVDTMGNDYHRQVYAALESKFGKPAEQTSEPMQNQMGATFDRVVATWRKPVNVLYMSIVNRINNGHIFVSTDTGSQAFEDESRRRRESSGRF